MAWKIEVDGDARKALKKMDPATARRILRYLRDLGELEDPTDRGKPLSANLAGMWRYRVGDYRIICEIRRGELVVLALEIAHRSAAY
ncbi:type II toxin-antitoxin system RelE family toxin [Zhihengliuella salsuginis]|uniref:RelE/StbE family addiction module toxin n=1 Tax=Zhihengliuella salsuginis TaxID=578222 RepID=A0ABQ3GMN2_9MICC|nr:type II toxin-antitoxin system RelE/ParE family toxin [Zhihengliuella salsuginis]GHD13805.1 RelE/StbE family addiction module toxin [Zhihengliuella salsuginis]